MWIKKLRSRRGETLTEVLVSILICGFSILMLASMMAAAMGINRRAREMDVGADGAGGFYGALSDVETHAFTAADPDCAVRLSGAGLAEISVPDVHSHTQGDSFPLTAYGKEVGA